MSWFKSSSKAPPPLDWRTFTERYAQACEAQSGQAVHINWADDIQRTLVCFRLRDGAEVAISPQQAFLLYRHEGVGLESVLADVADTLERIYVARVPTLDRIYPVIRNRATLRMGDEAVAQENADAESNSADHTAAENASENDSESASENATESAASSENPQTAHTAQTASNPPEGSAPAPASAPRPIDDIAVTLAGDLALTFVFDQPEAMTTLTRNHCIALGISDERALYDLALDNFSAYAGREDRTQLHSYEDVPRLYYFSLDEVYESSLLLFLRDILDAFQPELVGEPVVAVPARNVLLLCGSRDGPALAAMQQRVRQACESFSFLISTQLYRVLEDGSIVPFDPKAALE